MVSTAELAKKELINVIDGKRMGTISDIEINVDEGCVEALVLPSQAKIFTFFKKDEERVIKWSDVKKIGYDVILVDAGNMTSTPDNK